MKTDHETFKIVEEKEAKPWGCSYCGEDRELKVYETDEGFLSLCKKCAKDLDIKWENLEDG